MTSVEKASKASTPVNTDDMELKGEVHETHAEDINSSAEKAARFIEAEKSRSVWETIKLYRIAVAWIIYGQICCCGFGMDQIVSASLLAVPKFREDFGTPFLYQGYPTYIIPSYWISIYSGTSQAAGMVGAFLIGILADKLGRRNASLISCCVSIAGVGCQYASKGSLPVLTVGKTINGLALNSWLVLGPLYASEVAPLKLRGWLISMTSVSTYLGVLVFTGVMYSCATILSANAYQVPFALQWVVPVLILSTVLLWPESPAWLLQVGRREDAINSIKRLYGSGGIDTDGLLAEMEETLRLERELSGKMATVSYKECFEPEARARTLTTMFVYCCQYLSGITFVFGYQSYYFQIIGFNTRDSFVYTMLNNGIMMLAFPISWYLISTIGRRPLIVWGQFVGAILLFVIGGLSLSKSKSASKATVAMFVIWTFTFQGTVSGIAWVIGGEIPSLRLRARTQALASVVFAFTAWLMAFCFPYMLNPDSANLSGKVGFIFGAITLVSFLGCFFYVPETKGRTFEEIDILYDKKVNPRHFAKTDATLL